MSKRPGLKRAHPAATALAVALLTALTALTALTGTVAFAGGMVLADIRHLHTKSYERLHVKIIKNGYKLVFVASDSSVGSPFELVVCTWYLVIPDTPTHWINGVKCRVKREQT